MQRRYQNSLCGKRGEWLHDFQQLEVNSHGSLERCKKCGMTKMFQHGMPNHLYLSFHIRSVLRKGDARFIKEYPNITT